MCSSDVNAKGYSRFFDITAIEVYTVSCDCQQREKIATVLIFYHYYFIWIDTLLIKHTNLPGLVLSQGQ